MGTPNWDESQHPRAPAGSDIGGQFVSSGGGGGSPRWSVEHVSAGAEVTPKVAYHVTFTKNVKRIQREGIRPFQPSLWTKGGGERYTEEATIYAFENKRDAIFWAGKMDWDFNQETGSGKISIVTITKPGTWQVDTADPLSQSGAAGRWLKRVGAVPASSIGTAEPVTTDMVREAIAQRDVDSIDTEKTIAGLSGEQLAYSLERAKNPSALPRAPWERGMTAADRAALKEAAKTPQWGDAKQQLSPPAILSELGERPANSKKIHEVARELNARSNKILQDAIGQDRTTFDEKSGPGHTAETDDFVSDVIANELKASVGNFPGFEHWYGDRTKAAFEVIAEMHPEVKTDANQRFLYTAAIAVTSQGRPVSNNASAAEQQYQTYQKTGKFNATGYRDRANFRKLNKLIQDHGVENVRKMFETQFVARDLEKAVKIKIDANKGDKVWGSHVLGPKIGSFFQNLNGNHEPVTIDRWFMRAWGRVTGNGIGEADVGALTERLTNALKAEGRPVPKGPGKTLALARKLWREHEATFRKLTKEQRKTFEKPELSYAAERYVLGIDNGMKEEPTSPGQRNWIISVFKSAVDKLDKAGIKLSPAAAQAAWWAPEQELYKKLGADVEEVGNDYEKAFRKVADDARAKRTD